MCRPNVGAGHRFRRLATFSVTALLATVAQAGRPLFTDDADILNEGACEWVSYAARATESGLPSQTAWITQVGCGFGWDSQAGLALGHTASVGGSADELALSGKTGLIARAEGSVGLTVAWAIVAAGPAGASLKHSHTFLALLATSSLTNDLTGHANLGWTRHEPDGRSRVAWNLALERAMPGGVDLLGEIYGLDRNEPWLGLGVRYALQERLSVDASYSLQLGSPRNRLVTLGFKLNF